MLYDGIWVKVGFWWSDRKVKKSEKCKGRKPHLRVYTLVLVVTRKECDFIRVDRLRICDRESLLRWSVSKSSGLKWFFDKWE